MDALYDIAYEYDIRACAYNVIRLLGIHIHDLELVKEDKDRRNVLIGRYWREHKHEHQMYRACTSTIIDEYKSQVRPEAIICDKFDGFISIEKIPNTNCSLLPIELRHIYMPLLLITSNQYIGLDVLPNKKPQVICKGFAYKTIGFERVIYNQLFLFAKERGIGVRDLLSNPVHVKDLLMRLYSKERCEEDPDFFIIPRDSEQFGLVKLRDGADSFIELNLSNIDLMRDVKLPCGDIDYDWYYKHQFKEVHLLDH